MLVCLGTDGEYELKDPFTAGVVTDLSSRSETCGLRIVDSAWKTGDPGVVFVDRINASSCEPCSRV